MKLCKNLPHHIEVNLINKYGQKSIKNYWDKENTRENQNRHD